MLAVPLSRQVTAQEPGQGARVHCLACEEAGAVLTLPKATFYNSHCWQCQHMSAYRQRHGGGMRPRKRPRYDESNEEGAYHLSDEALLMAALANSV